MEKNPAAPSSRQKFPKPRGTCPCDIPEAEPATGLDLAPWDAAESQKRWGESSLLSVRRGKSPIYEFRQLASGQIVK